MKKSLDQIIENRLINGWIKSFSRHPDQFNKPHEADAELIALPGLDLLAALTVDTVDEEIELGFYKDPYTIGWMAATVTLSDLAAVGADPVGLLLSVTLPNNASSEYQRDITRGIEEACRNAGTHILGGDTNFGPHSALTTAGIGLVSRDKVLLRTGCGSGDLLCSTGQLGSGAPVAMTALFGSMESDTKTEYRPMARIRESTVLQEFASACMDSSDGLIATLDQLVRLNGVGFELTTLISDFLDSNASTLCKTHGLDPLIMLAQPHGEFELIFTLPESKRELFDRHAERHEFDYICLGRVIPEQTIRITQPVKREIDSTRIRNLLYETGGDLNRYREELIKLISTS